MGSLGKGNTANWTALPLDVTWMILSRLPQVQLLTSAQYVCSAWRTICRDPLRWRHLHLEAIPHRYRYNYVDSYHHLCRCAVKLSCRSLERLFICAFATDRLLRYVVLRTDTLKHLRLVHCVHITSNGLKSIAAQVPLLEELEISDCIDVCHWAIKAFALNCPSLSSFNYRGLRGRQTNGSIEVSSVIGKSMPGLVHLKINRSYVSNDDLEAILDGCPRLESLDLRRCIGLNLDGEYSLLALTLPFFSI